MMVLKPPKGGLGGGGQDSQAVPLGGGQVNFKRKVQDQPNENDES
jgi:hypothetical protein